MPSITEFRKVLSLNDTGSTGSHMAGILIPRSDINAFPKLESGVKNPRASLSMMDREGKKWELSFIYYNSEFYDGSGDEYRLTGLTEFIEGNGLIGGDTLIIRLTAEGDYFLDFEKSHSSARFPPAPETRLSSLEGREEDRGRASHEHAMRPAARIIHTIGEHLIKDAEAAVIELVKNAYDADAKNVFVQFRNSLKNRSRRELRITIEDDGHGMTYDQVVGAWLVPATSNKVSRRHSPAGRLLQGNKGIGRFAAFMLGSEVFLQTVSREQPVETSLLLQSSDFDEAEFLDQVRVIVDTRDVAAGTPVGAVFEMTSYEGDESFRRWKREDFAKLRADLRRMLFPFRSRDDQFTVWIEYLGFEEGGQSDGTEEIEPLPILDFFDYRIKVKINEAGKVEGVFSSPLLLGKDDEAISFTLEDLKGVPCGQISADIRVVDREPASIQSLLDRSSAAKNSLSGIGRAQLKRLLNEACGVSIFRGDFRIRPYGDHGNDWLGLDRQRVNNPSFCVGNNQTFGTVVIEAEEYSHLQEKSARDGLREDEHYSRLCDIVSRVISELQRRRYEIRRSVGRIEKTTRVKDMLNRLTDYADSFNQISNLLRPAGISQDKIASIEQVLKKDSEERLAAVAKLEQTIAIYQGQATLGKMVGVLLHEGNRALGILRNQADRMPKWMSRLTSNPTSQVVTEVSKGLDGITIASDTLIQLFDRIYPLGVRSRGAPREVALTKSITTAIRAFESRLSSVGIAVQVKVPLEFKILAWDQDINCIFLNLIENSIYWLEHSKTRLPEIVFELVNNEEVAQLNITDNGPGIPREHILSETIFEPAFSLKGGWGLGLPIAGECAIRNKFELRAVHTSVGARFILDFKPQPK